MCVRRLSDPMLGVSFDLQNCIDKTAEWMKSNLEVVLGVAFGIAILLVSARAPPSFSCRHLGERGRG